MPDLGDMPSEEFRAAGHDMVDWIAAYFAGGHRYPVLSRVAPGEVTAALEAAAPERGTPIPDIIAEFERTLVPGLTHWNQPGFMAYFSSSSSGPGVLGELLTAALNQQAMLWQTSPAATELEAVVLGWVRDLVGLPREFEGVIHDGGSSSNLHAMAAARTAAIPDARERGLAGERVGVYASEHAHASVDKALIMLGLGLQALRKIPVDSAFRLRPDVLRAAIRLDLARGVTPLAVVATVGTTSTASVDPLPAIADICAEARVWMHVDAAYAGPAAMLPEHRWIFNGANRADSLSLNPHKWMYTPLDLSAFYCRRMNLLRTGLGLTPAYLQTRTAGSTGNLMDTGIPLGRRFRALKLWMVLRYFGAAGMRARIEEQIRAAREFAAWVGGDAEFELLAPPSLSVVCFRAAPKGFDDPLELDALNADLLERVNGSGEVYLSATQLRGAMALRLAVGNIRTTAAHVARAWEIIRKSLRTAARRRLDSRDANHER